MAAAEVVLACRALIELFADQLAPPHPVVAPQSQAPLPASQPQPTRSCPPPRSSPPQSQPPLPPSWLWTGWLHRLLLHSPCPPSHSCLFSQPQFPFPPVPAVVPRACPIPPTPEPGPLPCAISTPDPASHLCSATPLVSWPPTMPECSAEAAETPAPPAASSSLLNAPVLLSPAVSLPPPIPVPAVSPGATPAETVPFALAHDPSHSVLAPSPTSLAMILHHSASHSSANDIPARNVSLYRLSSILPSPRVQIAAHFPVANPPAAVAVEFPAPIPADTLPSQEWQGLACQIQQQRPLCPAIHPHWKPLRALPPFQGSSPHCPPWVPMCRACAPLAVSAVTAAPPPSSP